MIVQNTQKNFQQLQIPNLDFRSLNFTAKKLIDTCFSLSNQTALPMKSKNQNKISYYHQKQCTLLRLSKRVTQNLSTHPTFKLKVISSRKIQSQNSASELSRILKCPKTLLQLTFLSTGSYMSNENFRLRSVCSCRLALIVAYAFHSIAF